MSDGRVHKVEDESESTSTRILDFIRKHPGSHLREIKRSLTLGMGTVQYHLYRLEKEGEVISRRRGLYKRFYPRLIFGDEQLEVLNVLSQETERNILLFLIQNPNATQKEVSSQAAISPATASWHMNRLSAANLVEAKRDGVNIRYTITGNRNEILGLLRSYHPLIWKEWANRLADVFLEISDTTSRRDDS